MTDWLSSSREVKLNHAGEPVEVELASALQHDYIVCIHASHTRKMGEIESNASVKVMQTWLVMEHCNQGSLAEAIDSGRFQTARSKAWAFQTSSVLSPITCCFGSAVCWRYHQLGKA